MGRPRLITTKPIGFEMTWNAFDACLSTIAKEFPVTPKFRAALWRALNGVEPERLPPIRFDHWTREALALLEPLRLEQETCKQSQRKGTIDRRYLGITATLPGGGRGRRPEVVVVLEEFDAYCIELLRIEEAMEDALTEGNHRRFAGIAGQPEPEPLDIIVENERTANRHAGTVHWTQWALPNVKARITEVFEQARKQTPQRGRSWVPYPLTLKEQP